jgi:hypothetical protein
MARPGRKEEAMKLRRGFAAFGALAVTLSLGASSALAEGCHRSNELHVTKECSELVNEPGGFCTITSSNVSVIKAGMKVIYAEAADPVTFAMDSDIILSSGHGPVAYGHVVLDVGGSTGTVTLDGGTGRFRNFHAIATVTCPDICYWDGTYHFDRHEHED